MVKVLVVLVAPDAPLVKGRTAVGPLLDGVASFSTVCVWPLCSAGLAQGSASMFSKESFLKRRDLEGESRSVSCFGDVGISSDCGESSPGSSEALLDLTWLNKGNEGSGRSDRYLISSTSLEQMERYCGQTHGSVARPPRPRWPLPSPGKGQLEQRGHWPHCDPGHA